MKPVDVTLLIGMRDALHAYSSKTTRVGDLADELLGLRDELQFKDYLWEHELTQQIATLDSASTFTPKNEEQSIQVQHAIEAAIKTILQLVENKLS